MRCNGKNTLIEVMHCSCFTKREGFYYLNGDDRLVGKIGMDIQEFRLAFPVVGFVNGRFFACIPVFIATKLNVWILLVYTVQPGEVPGLVPCLQQTAKCPHVQSIYLPVNLVKILA